MNTQSNNVEEGSRNNRSVNCGDSTGNGQHPSNPGGEGGSAIDHQANDGDRGIGNGSHAQVRNNASVVEAISGQSGTRPARGSTHSAGPQQDEAADSNMGGDVGNGEDANERDRRENEMNDPTGNERALAEIDRALAEMAEETRADRERLAYRNAGAQHGDEGTRYAAEGQEDPPGRRVRRPNLTPMEWLQQVRKKTRLPGKTTRASLKIGTLNMKGRRHDGVDKWLHINQILREEKIAILAMQETHLTEEESAEIEDMPGFERMKIFLSVDEEHPRREGVVLVFNKNITPTEDVSMEVIIPGRAILVTTKWHGNKQLRILVVYAPCPEGQNGAFWDKLTQEFSTRPSPNLMMGDCNVVESALDTLPQHEDQDVATIPLANLKGALGLVDGWRQTFPTSRAYTFKQSEAQGGAQSRIDRIYMKQNMTDFCKDWEIGPSGISTDHQLVTVKVSARNMPFIGHGRWTVPLLLLKDRKLMKQIGQSVLNVETEMRGSDDGKQAVYAEWKTNVIEMLREAGKTAIPKLEKEMKEIRTEIRTMNNDPTVDDDEKVQQGGMLQDQVDEMARERHMRTRDNLAVRVRINDESATSKSWASRGRDKRGRDTIMELKVPNSDPPEYVTRSDEMARTARDYHDDLQNKDRAPSIEQRAAMQNMLEEVETSLPNTHKAKLAEYIKEGDLAEVLKKLKNGSSPGLDGLQYEVWKALFEMSKQGAGDGGRNAPNIVSVLTMLFRDIEEKGIMEGFDFANGWLCPLYKKNDKRQIANYRPITLLNSDYKIFTKILAIRMAKACPTVVHVDQAGFIPGRSIMDQIRLTQMIINYAEVEEENGMIVLLDQEKVYDKIEHAYLWKTLEAYNFPQLFIRTVKSLYEHAETCVIINGEKSTHYKVSRGVRQGDPLSCLLFDIAIEPLASMLRQSDLKGYKAPGAAERTIVSLFADDTMIYLHEDDDYNELLDVLSQWCKASGAKFNTSKTEAILLGKTEYRENLRLLRKLSEGGDTLPTDLKIAGDDDARRTLGAWVGNNVNEVGVWSTIIEKIETKLERWEKTHPTIEGQKTIIQWTIGSMTQYQTAAQGMPSNVLKQLCKRAHEFLWDNAGRSPLSQRLLCAPISEGGKNALDLEARNDAIALNMVKGYLEEEDKRAPWTRFARALMQKNTELRVIVDEKAGINSLAQSWNPKKKGLQRQLKEMLRVTKKYGVKLEALAVSKETLRSMPVWFHIGADDELNKLNNYYFSKCLRDNHEILTVGQMERIATPSLNNHRQRADCQCEDCSANRGNHGCAKPFKCRETARRIMQCILPKWNPMKNQPRRLAPLTDDEKMRNEAASKEKKEVRFNPAITHTGSYQSVFRVFVEADTTREPQANQQIPPLRLVRDTAQMTTCGKFKVNADGFYVSSAGVWFGENDNRNKSLRLSEEMSTKGCGELVVMLEGLKEVPPLTELRINTSSKGLLESLTTKLGKNEERGWLGHPNKKVMQNIVACLRKRGGRTTFRLSDQSDNPWGMRRASKLAKQGMDKPRADNIRVQESSPFHLQGEKIGTSSQASLYKHIKAKKPQTARRHTMIKLGMTVYAVAAFNGSTPSNEEVWKSVRDKDIPKAIRGFLWKNLHRAYKIGDFWSSIPNYEQRARCGLCGDDETMEHILFECQESTAAKTIWARAEQLWRKKYDDWPEPGIGLLLGSGLVRLRDRADEMDRGKSRLFKIIIQESAHMVWKIRCKRVIERSDDPESWHGETEVHNTWLWAINRRLSFNRLMADKDTYGANAIDKGLVLQTWSGVLHEERNLPSPYWTRQSGVLVGIERLPPPGG